MRINVYPAANVREPARWTWMSPSIRTIRNVSAVACV